MENDRQAMREKLQDELVQRYIKEHGTSRDNLPSDVSNAIQIQAALGEDFDPQKIAQVHEAFVQCEIDRYALFEANGEKDIDELPETERAKFTEIMTRPWRLIAEILGEENFQLVYDMSSSDGIEMFRSIAQGECC